MDNKLLNIIQIVASERIFPFEWQNENYQFPDDDEILLEEYIRHPFIVTELSDNYLLLDGSPDYYRLSKIGLKHIPVQLINPTDVEISPLRLSLINFSFHDLMRLVEKYPSQIIVDDHLKNKNDDYITLFFKFNDIPDLKVFLRNSSRSGCPFPLEIIFRTIYEKGRIVPVYDRRVDKDSLTTLKNQSGSILMPSFTLDDLKTAASSERYFPPSTINIIPKQRVLNIDFPVKVLNSDLPLSEISSFLKELIILREQNCKTHYYQGQIYLLNQ